MPAIQRVFYNSRSLWHSDAEITASAISPPDQRIALLSGSSLTIIPHPNTSTATTRLSKITIDLPELAETEVIGLRWSRSGMSLGAATRDGVVVLMSSMGVVMAQVDMTSEMKASASFDFLSDSVILVASRDGRLFLWNSIDAKASTVHSVSRYHQWPQIHVDATSRLCVMGGIYQYDDENITLWRYSDRYDDWTLLYCMKSPFSLWTVWMQRPVPRPKSFRFDFGFSNNQLCLVSYHGHAPIVIQINTDSVNLQHIAGIPQDIAETVKEAVFWDDTTIVMSTIIGRLLFIDITINAGEVLTSEIIPDDSSVIGRCNDHGIVLSTSRRASKYSLSSLLSFAYLYCSSGEMDSRLVLMERQSVQEHLSGLIEKSAFDEALRVAEATEQPKDEIYKSMWKMREQSFVTFNAFTDFMQNVTDDCWILQSCSETVCTTTVDQHRLIEYGLDVCDKKIREQPRDGDLLKAFIRLLRGHEICSTFDALHPGCFNSEAFEVFQRTGIEDVARGFAQSGNVQALQVLQRRHPYSLINDWLSILGAFPCTMDPMQYRSILPSTETMATMLSNFTSTLSDDRRRRVIEIVTITDDVITDATPLPDCLNAILHAANNRPPTPSLDINQLMSFYKSMAQRIERETGDLQLVNSLLKCGVEKGVQQLESMRLEISIFESWLSVATEFWNWTSDGFSKLTIEQRISHIMPSTSTDNINQRIESVFVPLNHRLPINEASALRQSLLTFMLQRGSKLFETVITMQFSENGLFGTSEAGYAELINAAIRAIEIVDRITDWDAVYEGLDTISRQGTVYGTHMADISTALTDVLDNVHLGSLLEKYDVAVSYSQMVSLKTEEGQRLVRSILGHGMRMSANWSDADWDGLLSDVITIALRMSQLCKSGFDIDGLKAEYFQTLLRASKFSLAEAYFVDNLDYAVAEEIAWKIGREILCSITDMDYSAATDEAKSCFNLFPTSTRAQNEIRKLRGLLAIRSNFALSILPMEFEQMPSVSDLIGAILTQSPKHYKKRIAFLSLADDLNIHGVEFSTGWTQLFTIALKHHDLHKAKEFVQDMRERNLPDTWPRAWELLKADESQGYLKKDEKQDLWTFVVMNCDHRLQECIDEMKEAFETMETAEPTPTIQLSAHEDAYRYFINVSYRQQLKSTPTSLAAQKCNIYDFILDGLESVNNNCTESAAFVRTLLEASPHDVAILLKESPQFLHSGKEANDGLSSFEQHLSQLQTHDHLQSVAQTFRALLPGLDVTRFSDAADAQYRKAIVLELASYAAELLYKQSKSDILAEDVQSQWHRALEMALEHADEFDVDSAQVHLVFICTICPLIDGPFHQISQAIAASEKVLVAATGVYLQEILKRTWSEVSNAFSVAFTLRILMRFIPQATRCPHAVILKKYAAYIIRITPIAAEFDFRIPVVFIMSLVTTEVFAFEFNWVSDTSELQNIYSAVDDDNHREIEHLYELLALPEEKKSEAVFSAQQGIVRLVFIIKKLLSQSWHHPFQDEQFWNESVGVLSAESLRSLIEFAVFANSSLLTPLLSSLNEAVREQMKCWESTSHEAQEVVEIRQLLLEKAISYSESIADPSAVEDIEKWISELKRMRRRHATQHLGDIGVHITGNTFSDDIQSIVRTMILEQHRYSSILKTITDYAERADESYSVETLEQAISDSVLSWIAEDVMSTSGSTFIQIIQSLNEQGSQHMQHLQKETWQRIIDSLKPCEDAVRTMLVVTQLTEILLLKCWSERTWPISREHRWMIFSWSVEAHIINLSNTSASICSITSANLQSTQTIESLVDSLLADQLALAPLCLVLDTMASCQEVLAHEVEELWLCSFYSKAMQAAIESGNSGSVLRYLCERYADRNRRKTRFLTQDTEQQLFSAMQKVSQCLATCFGLLLPSTFLRQRCLSVLPKIDGSVNTLAVLLSATADDLRFDELLDNRTWLTELLAEIPPHLSLINHWETHQPTTISAEGLAHPPTTIDNTTNGSGDGWDVDDDLVFEEAIPVVEQASEERDGWEIDEELVFEDPENVAETADDEGWDIDQDLALEELEEKAVRRSDEEGWDIDDDILLQDIDDISAVPDETKEHEIQPSSPDLKNSEVVEASGSHETQPVQSQSQNKEIVTSVEHLSGWSFLLKRVDHFAVVVDFVGKRERSVAGSCCFPTFLSALTKQGRVDMAATILARKLHYHPQADALTGGVLFLKRFLRKATTESSIDVLLDVLKEEAQDLWSQPLLKYLLDNQSSYAQQGLALLEGN